MYTTNFRQRNGNYMENIASHEAMWTPVVPLVSNSSISYVVLMLLYCLKGGHYMDVQGTKVIHNISMVMNQQ